MVTKRSGDSSSKIYVKFMTSNISTNLCHIIKKTRKSRKQENQCFSQFYRLTNSNNSNYIGLMLG